MSIKFPSCTLLFHLRYTHTNSGDWKKSLPVRCPRRISQQSSSRNIKTSPVFASLWWPPTPPVYCCLHLAWANAGTWLSVRTTHAAAASWCAKTWRAISNTLVSICYDKSADIIVTWSKLKVSIYIKDMSQMLLKKKKKKISLWCIVLPILY